jgi:hypothetical protein
MPLSFKQLQNLFISGPNINIYPSGNNYAISGSGGSGNTGTIISGTNIGTGIGVFQGLQTTTILNDTLGFYSLLQGDNVGIITNDNGEIVINRGRTVVNTILNQGGGARVFTGITGSSIIARTISGSAGLTSALFNSPTTGASSAITANTLVRIAPTNTTASRFYIEDSSGNFTTNANFTLDTTSGVIGIGSAVSVLTRLLIGAGTSAITQLTLTPSSSEPISPTDGDIWYNTSNELKMQKGSITSEFLFGNFNNALTAQTGTSSSLLFLDSGGTITTIDSDINRPRHMNSFGLFNALSSVTISDTTTETSIISPVLTGSTTLLSSNNSYNPELVVGRKYRFSARGILGSDVPPVNLNIRIKLGSTIISSSSTISIGSGTVDPINLEFDIESTFTVRNSGLIVGSGKIIFSAPASGLGGAGELFIFGVYSQNATIDTASNKVFDCTVQLDVADPTNFITIYESTLEVLN